MKTKIVPRHTLPFYLLALVLSWVFWLALLARGTHVKPFSNGHFPGLLGPTFAAVLAVQTIDMTANFRRAMTYLKCIDFNVLRR